MPLVKNTDKFPERPVLILLVGTPFSRKTSLANTAKNPILIDADRGADRSWGRPDTFVIKEGWKELEDEDTAGLFNGYDTAILDTAKAILDDFLMEHVIGKNYKLRTNKMQMYGAIGDEFKIFVNRRRAQNMDIIVISHDKTKDDDGIATINPDITGGSKNLILRIADQVGFVSNKTMKNDKGDLVPVVTVNFNPSETAPFCKNVANLPELVLPHYSDGNWKLFMDREIIQPTKAAISRMTEEQREALDFIEGWHFSIDAIAPDGNSETTAAELLKTLDGIVSIEAEHLKKQVRAYFQAHLKKIGWAWDNTKKGFIPKGEKPKDDKPSEVKETPPAENPQSQTPDSNPAGLALKNGAIGDGVDLFAPRGDHAQDAFDQEQAEIERDMQREED